MKFQILFIFLLITQILRGSPILKWGTYEGNLTGYIALLEDRKGEMTIENVLKDTTNWQNYPSDYLQLGYQNSYYWLRLDIDFDSIPKEKLYWWFEISAPEDIQFYHISNDTIVKYVKTGINFPFKQRDVLNRHFIFSFQPTQKGKTRLFARIHNDVGTVIGYSFLHTASEFAIIDRKNVGIWAVFFTFLFFAALTSLALWLVFKERIYVYYCAYLLCGALLLISTNGFGYEWIWPESSYTAIVTKVIWIYGLTGFLMLFVYRLLFEVLKKYKKLKITIRILSIALGIYTIIALTYRFFPLILIKKILFINSLLLLSCVIVILIMLGIGIYKRYLLAYYFFFAVLPVAITSILMILRNIGLIKSEYLQSSFLLFPAFFIEIILLFVALLMRFRALSRTQQEKIQLELESQYRLQHERERISRDLHDNVGAQLSYIISNIEHSLENPNKSNYSLEDTADAAKNAILNLRETIWAINNEQITVEDFYDRFKLYASNQIKNRTDIQLTFKENIEENHVLEPNLALNLYRIIQEAFTNALKYAHADTIEIFIKTNDKAYFEFLLKDNGVGFTLDKDIQVNTEGGYGLKNMKARAQEIGASFNIFTEKDKGTLVEVFVENTNQIRK